MAKRILIADDSSFMRTILKKVLLPAGYDIAGEAANGLEAVERFTELKPDLVILDVTMPEIDGIEALRRIMTLDPEALCIICSAIGQRWMIVQAIEYGAKDFIVKPFQADRILTAIDNTFANAEPPEEDDY